MNTDKPKATRKLKNINVFEVSFVDKAANGQKFIMWKNEGGLKIPLETYNPNITKEDNDKGGDNVNAENIEEKIVPTDEEKIAKLAEINKKLPDIDWTNPAVVAELEKRAEEIVKKRQTLDDPKSVMGNELKKEAIVKAADEKEAALKELTASITKSVKESIMEEISPLLPQFKVVDAVSVEKREEDPPEEKEIEFVKSISTPEGRAPYTAANAENPANIIMKAFKDSGVDGKRLKVQE